MPAAPSRIIIVDDDPLIVDIVCECLGKRGHIVGGMPAGEKACGIIEFKQPDLVILDCVLPGKSGIEVLREIRSSRVACTIPVLMLTGRQGEADELIAARAGADDYLRKPFDPDQLVAHVEVLLEANRV
ncbi:response regulator transcription factor [Sphingosinicella sp. BN140058]|nr:response regulator transcription factor [Sphingosinicella sp. BN140058]